MITKLESAAALPDLVYDAHHLVAWDYPFPAWRQIALGQMQIGTAHATGQHPQPNLAGCWVRIWQLNQPQRTALDRTGRVDDPGPHRQTLRLATESAGTWIVGCCMRFILLTVHHNSNLPVAGSGLTSKRLSTFRPSAFDNGSGLKSCQRRRYD